MQKGLLQKLGFATAPFCWMEMLTGRLPDPCNDFGGVLIGIAGKGVDFVLQILGDGDRVVMALVGLSSFE